MQKTDRKYQTYINILKKELLPTMGCTEPVALAYAAAKAKEVLGALPDRIELAASGSVIKNIKSVIVPHTNGLKGMEAAIAAGVCVGEADKELEVLSAKNADSDEIKEYMDKTPIAISCVDNGNSLEMDLTVYRDEERARVLVLHRHTNIVLIEKNDRILLDLTQEQGEDVDKPDYSLLDMESIYDFAETVDTNDVEETLSRQINYNTAIAKEGLSGEYGAGIGHVLLASLGHGVHARAKAMAAAGADARMSGCEMPVVINSGSGNQGLTCSLPVLEYAKEYGLNEERTYRALTLSNLVAIHIRNVIGRLSAFCGAVSAGAAAGAGIAYVCGGDYKAVSHTVVNTIAITSGIICDGAKASCAAKIATSIDAGLLGYNMYKDGHQFCDGDGIVTKGVEANIHNAGLLERLGTEKTDKEIIKMMLNEKGEKND